MKVLLAQKLREFRKKQGLTQEQLAEAMGVTVGAEIGRASCRERV